MDGREGEYSSLEPTQRKSASEAKNAHAIFIYHGRTLGAGLGDVWGFNVVCGFVDFDFVLFLPKESEFYLILVVESVLRAQN
jgi:hypothetical protein